MALVRTEGLTRRFGETLAVEDVAMTVPDRAVYAFVGPNGSGKTTTLKMLLGLIAPTAGRVLIDGLDVATHRETIARQVGALLEAQGFYVNLTGAENLDLTRRLLGLPVSEIDRTLALVDMNHARNRRVAGYSLGMRQRLGIARAMLGSPRLLILDEPTNGLDPDGIAQMRSFLRDLPERSGATVLVSSHLLSEIEHSASHVGIMHRGRLVREGRLDDLRALAARRIRIRTPEPVRLVARLAPTFAAALDGVDIVVPMTPATDVADRVAAISRLLIDAGLPFTGIGEQSTTLEHLYADSVPTDLKVAA
ncbi:ABC transporter ATP-binding protein [Sphingomonas floccifaciens]|uniref:ABC transporter ATP-binding protein n=1 Tax=Sphingomonas floccifaciens TaxID=1844115 RepID=A0ABW4N8I7_9SPHN